LPPLERTSSSNPLQRGSWNRSLLLPGLQARELMALVELGRTGILGRRPKGRNDTVDVGKHTPYCDNA